jgi:hypothetical protein
VTYETNSVYKAATIRAHGVEVANVRVTPTGSVLFQFDSPDAVKLAEQYELDGIESPLQPRVYADHIVVLWKITRDLKRR